MIAMPAMNGFQAVWSCDNTANFIQLYISNPAGTPQVGHGFNHGFGDVTVLTPAAANTVYSVVSVVRPNALSTVWASTGSGAPVSVNDTRNAGTWPDPALFIFNEKALDEFTNGDVWDFAFWQRELSSSEIHSVLMKKLPLPKNKLQYFLPLRNAGGPEINRAGFGANFVHNGSLGFTAFQPQEQLVRPGALQNKLRLYASPPPPPPPGPATGFACATVEW